MSPRRILLCGMLVFLSSNIARGEDAQFKLESQVKTENGFRRESRDVTWPMERTAVIVCDVWDYHHSINAVRRLEEFAPRLNDFVTEARRRGATIIHSPSDCMPAYEEHAARKRAIQTPKPKEMPAGVGHWVSKIDAEKGAVYPIDQSDGGEDDDPAEHAEWAAKLKLLGRNPGMPWQTESPAITIDAERDYISDRGDEVWAILEARGIDHVILAGVHANMCVLGRPFGLRQMVRNGKDVVFLKDVSDSMYNPKRWPFVDHFSGHDLVVNYIERYVCPTIESHQLLGGEPFRSKFDKRSLTGIQALEDLPLKATPEWTLVSVPRRELPAKQNDVVWYRCAVGMPAEWKQAKLIYLSLELRHNCQAWLNGHEFGPTLSDSEFNTTLNFDASRISADEANFLVIRVQGGPERTNLLTAPPKLTGESEIVLEGAWQMRIGDDPAWKSIPLPAKFGASPEIYFEP